jgi:hypothetical protein
VTVSDEAKLSPAIAGHGAAHLPAVTVDSYNVELRDDDGFVGDRANKKAFRTILDDWRKKIRETGEDPFGDEPSEEITHSKLDDVLTKQGPEAAGLVQSAIEDYAQELVHVTRRFLKLKGWRDAERLLIGGGMRARRYGELAIGRATVLLKSEGVELDVVPIRHDPNEAGLIGAVQLAPAWVFKGHEAILAIDIGGTNMRAGLVELNLKQAKDLSKASVAEIKLWRHADDKPKRTEAIDNLVEMLQALIARAGKDKVKLAPFIGIGCPGKIEPDGSIDRGAQNLPGKWTSPQFNLPAEIRQAIATIGDDETAIVMHNDAVLQGLSEVPFMRDVERWGVFTIGTGLGNALFTTRPKD